MASELPPLTFVDRAFDDHPVTETWHGRRKTDGSTAWGPKGRPGADLSCRVTRPFFGWYAQDQGRAEIAAALVGHEVKHRPGR